MPLFERQTKDAGARDPLDLFGHVFHPCFGFRRPPDGLLGADIEAWNLQARGEEDIAWRGAQNVLHVAPQPRFIVRAVDADAPEHDQPGICLARMVEDLLEGLAVEECFLDRDARLAPHPLADLEMRLVDLREAGVDNL